MTFLLLYFGGIKQHLQTPLCGCQVWDAQDPETTMRVPSGPGDRCSLAEHLRGDAPLWIDSTPSRFLIQPNTLCF